MKHPLLAALIAAGVGPAFAETPMTADEFDAYVTGKTLDWLQMGSVFGTEEYLPGRRVHWGPVDETCQVGTWYGEGDNICFLYEGDPEPKCWTVWQDGDGLTARYLTDPPDIEPSVVEETNEPLSCSAPDVGV